MLAAKSMMRFSTGSCYRATALDSEAVERLSAASRARARWAEDRSRIGTAVPRTTQAVAGAGSYTVKSTMPQIAHVRSRPSHWPLVSSSATAASTTTSRMVWQASHQANGDGELSGTEVARVGLVERS